MIFINLKEKWKGNGGITDYATLSEFLEKNLELAAASYPTNDEISSNLKGKK